MVEIICTIGLTLCIGYYVLSAIVGIIDYFKEKKEMTDEIWARKVKDGMKLIMDGCKSNPSDFNCKACPFDLFCTSIWKDKEHRYSTPNHWKSEGFEF